MAHLSREKGLLTAFAEGKDIHGNGGSGVWYAS
ncbi:hypothetical protein ACLK1S_24050 [Escherichia coli]